MLRKLIVTNDGSHSISVPDMNVMYHSIHGAIQESWHVFIEAGLHACAGLERPGGLRIFEMGFGTGLNALLTLIEAEKRKQKIYYEAVELFPLNLGEALALNYCELLDRTDLQSSFEHLHNSEWGRQIQISNYFGFTKLRRSLIPYETDKPIDLIYFDAFDPTAQPELWSQEIFQKMFFNLKQDGVLVTYSSKGDVRRAMQAAGFKVEKIPGPPGKREITRALKAK